ncbi:MAG: RHS repeat-associated core domain-containing protein [Clostridia bacterium]|nr:RHS repeat-associated core domain-containing protein [Clostridia bacterium]
MYNADGEKIGSYTYDAWGNCTVSVVSGNTTLENNIVRTLNPFRYRGYYYDTETQLYYLQSRYYNPAWGRFLNEDAYVNANGDLIGFNMYAYCSNNPIMGCDPTGEIAWHIVIGAAIGGLVSGASTFIGGVITHGMEGKEFTADFWFKLLGATAISTVLGAISGGLAASGLVGAGGLMAIDVASSAIESVYDTVVINGSTNAGEIITNTLIDVGISCLFSLVGGAGDIDMPQKYKAYKSANQTLQQTGVHPKVKADAQDAIDIYIRSCKKGIWPNFAESSVSSLFSGTVIYFGQKQAEQALGW